jgi:hypothetical protein
MNDPVEILKRSLAQVLPGLIVGIVGFPLILGVAVLILIEGAPLVRSITAGMSQPWRSIVLFVTLGAALVMVGWSGKRLMVYIVNRIRIRESV